MSQSTGRFRFGRSANNTVNILPSKRFNLMNKPVEKDFHIVESSQFQMPGVVVTAAKRIRVPQEPRKIFIKGEKTVAKKETQQGDATDEVQQEIAFSDVVDEDHNDAFQNYLSDELVGRLVEASPFRLFVLVIIVLNSIQAGVQTSTIMEQQFGSILSGMDNVFLTIFVIELLLKWYAGFRAFWTSSWNIFDFLVVAASIAGQGFTFLASTRVVRVLRVLRAFRSLRSITALQGLQIIVQTIVKAIPSMISIVLLLCIIMFIYSVTCVTIFSDSMSYYFGDIAKAMYTMFIFLTQDGWADVFIEMEANGYFYLGALISMTFIPLGAFIFVNLVTGITTNYLLQAYRDIKAQKRAKSRKLKQQKRRMDVEDIRLAIAGMKNQYADVMESNDIPASIYTLQKAIETPILSVGPRYVQNYLAILGAVEDNLREFRELKNELKKCMEETKAVNADTRYNYDDNVGQSSSDESESDEDMTGDALSMLLRERGKHIKNQRKRREASEKASLARRMHMIEAIQEEQSRGERTRLWAEGKFLI
ncbi:Cation Channel Sperm Associated 4 CatSper4 [Carpediemonas membranifera]|uniref:Cation Channel Sperm Associated 4 CatSper4 n=1 Tax=Carpediemonas membranifera TaxID=201153 RepID=A0A8J6AW46_9EUKA|nr:Cation Channel Sperm Associated 4 CatSper4 [Carpediemonas membranifera]|eukprot:KAG9396286.1 Cation Channel Sperm Associated 4 CatSper4 [Carpediemonas membranifera]